MIGGLLVSLVVGQQLVCRQARLPYHDVEALLVHDRRDVIAERQSTTSFLLEATYQIPHASYWIHVAGTRGNGARRDRCVPYPEIVKGLKYPDSCGLEHGCLNCSNILVGTEGDIKIGE